jgi:hypothetical protein
MDTQARISTRKDMETLRRSWLREATCHDSTTVAGHEGMALETHHGTSGLSQTIAPSYVV